MTNKILKTANRLAIASATGILLSSTAFAGGSIGGDCCADLEERVAELEATTVRKGNRKVSLELSGQVNKAIVFYDGPDGSDTAIIDNGNSGSRFRLKGSVKFSSDLYAGYLIELGVTHDTGKPVSLRHNDLYIGSKSLGKISIGHGSTATDGIANIDLSGTSLANGTVNRSGIAGGYKFNDLDGPRAERIRYDSPTLAGFKVSASWQDDEDYDLALRYGGSLGDFTLAAGIGYQDGTTTSLNVGSIGPFPVTIPLSDVTKVSGSASVYHTPTGLSLTFAAGHQETDLTPAVTFERDYWYLKAGIKRKLFSAGSTAFSVDYQNEEVGLNVIPVSAEAEKWGFQLVQKIDAAAMELYVSGWSSDIEGFLEEDVIMVGSRLKF